MDNDRWALSLLGLRAEKLLQSRLCRRGQPSRRRPVSQITGGFVVYRRLVRLLLLLLLLADSHANGQALFQATLATFARRGGNFARLVEPAPGNAAFKGDASRGIALEKFLKKVLNLNYIVLWYIK